jgi:hypothetical protein
MRPATQIVGEEIDLAVGAPALGTVGDRVIEAVAYEREPLVAAQSPRRPTVEMGQSAVGSDDDAVLWGEAQRALGARQLIFHRKPSGERKC